MGSRHQKDMLDLQQDILSCNELWGLLHKWLGPTKKLRLGQITYCIFQLARGLARQDAEQGEGSSNTDGRLSVACREECEDLFAEARRTIAEKTAEINRTPNPRPKLCVLRVYEEGLAELHERSKELQNAAKSVEKEVQEFIVSIYSLVVGDE